MRIKLIRHTQRFPVIEMDTLYYKTLLMVAELGSFSRAAERIHITQSAVSRRIAALESHFEQCLLKRNGANVVLTEFGHLALDDIRTIVATEERLTELPRGQLTSGAIKLGCTPTFARVHLEKLFQQFSCPSHSINFLSKIVGTNDIIEGLTKGTIDVAFFEHCGIKELDKLPHRDLERNEIVFLSSQTDLPNGEVSINDLLAFPIYCCPSQCCTRKLLENNLLRVEKRIDDFARVIELDDLHIMMECLKQQGGVSFLSRDLGRDELASGKLKEHRVPDFVHTRRCTVTARDQQTMDRWYHLYKHATAIEA